MVSGPVLAGAPAAGVEDPKPTRKDPEEVKKAKEGKADKEAKKEKRKKEKKAKKEEKGLSAAEQAQKEALEKVVEEQVEALRQERISEMPYLDRVYIRASITPLKIQKKEEFLQSGPKDLRDLIIRAKSVHTQAKAMHENIALYNRRMLYALRKLFPEMTANMNGREGNLSGNTFVGKDWHLSLRQPVFDGGILWNTFLQEKSGLEAARKQYDKTISELVFDLSKAYFEYQRTLQTVEEHKRAVQDMKRFAEMSEEKFKQKLISEIEQLNVQSSYSQMQFDLEASEQELEIAKLDMQKHLDLSVNDNVTLQRVYDKADLVAAQGGTGALPPVPDASSKDLVPVFKDEIKAPELVRLIDLSYANRPELQIEAARLQATRLGERIRWGEFLPKAFLTGEWGALGEAYRYQGYTSANSNVDNYDEPALKKEWRLLLEMNWNLGGNKVNYTYENDHKAPSITQYLYGQGTHITKNGVTIGVLDGLDAFINVKQAEVEKLNQVVELEKAEKQVLQDVKQAYYDYQKAVIQVRSTVKRMQYRERLRDFSKHRLSRKEIEISEYMQTEADLVREQSELHRALKDYFTAKAAMNHAVGIQDFLGIESPHRLQK
ncbi:MAG TPA: TolC family protein [Candidatus Omnitrophota bacterium]|nr:TolC family protein [Candidatus Omnitrophota bacterium]HPS36717.1 TolC family protein [Candidatus Omnitrophota bacterium]